MKMLWLALALLMAPATGAFAEGEGSCGDEGLFCGESERCCEHVVAMFSGESPSAPSYIKGQCIPKEQKCAAIWCGSRQCSGGIFGNPTVCCVNHEFGQAPEYTCARTELNCPGNTTQLSIRDTQPERRPLQRS